jgi:Leu/Phe-tRNA-protein transferase
VVADLASGSGRASWDRALALVAARSRTEERDESLVNCPALVGGQLDGQSLLSAYEAGLVVLDSDRDGAAISRLKYRTRIDSSMVLQCPTSAEVRSAISVACGNDDQDEIESWRLTWWSPDPRPLIKSWGDFRLSAGLSKSLRAHRAVRVATDIRFEEVVAGCRAGRQWEWMTDRFIEVVNELQSQQKYHCFAALDENDVLIGGAIALSHCGVLSVDSLFGQNGIGFACLATAVWSGLDSGMLVDLQWPSSHVGRMVTRYRRRTDLLDWIDAGHQRELSWNPGTVVSLSTILDQLRKRA